MTFTGHGAASEHEIDGTRESHRLQRAELRARMAAERAELLCALLGTDVAVLESRPLQGTKSASDLLSAVAAREDSFVAQLSRPTATSQTRATARTDADRLPIGFEEALAGCVGARSRFLDAFARVPDHVLFDESTGPAPVLSPLTMATQCHWSDASLSLRVNAWTRDQELGASIGPPSLLRAAVRAGRKELLTTVALVPGTVRELAIFEGGRSLPQVFRMIVRLELAFLAGLKRAGFASGVGDLKRSDAPEGSWEGTWSDLHTRHAAVIGVLDDLDHNAFAVQIADADGSPEPIYMWARGCLLHDRLHAGQIRAVLELDWPERLLR
jgi:hypothetical protein